MSRITNAAIIILLFSAAMLPLFAVASEENPEVVGEAGTGDVPFRDIIAGWVEDETATDFNMAIKVADSPPGWQVGNLDENMNYTIYDYEFYFSFRGAHYSATATVGMAVQSPGGLFDYVQSTGTLRTVKYTSSFNAIESEEGNTTLTVTWDSTRKVILLTIPKSNIENPETDEKITNLWIAIWNTETTPADELRIVEEAKDHAGTYLSPGRDYIFTGGLQYEYALTLSTPDRDIDVASGEKETANITITYTTTSDEESNTTVELSIVHTGPGTSSLAETSFSFNGSDTRTTVFTFTAPSNVTEALVANISIRAVMTVVEDGTPVVSNAIPLNITVSIIPEETADEEETENFVEWLMGFMTTTQGLALLAGIVVVIALLAVLVSRRRSKKRE